jgi:CRP-like cAMP-binding protein
MRALLRRVSRAVAAAVGPCSLATPRMRVPSGPLSSWPHHAGSYLLPARGWWAASRTLCQVTQWSGRTSVRYRTDSTQSGVYLASCKPAGATAEAATVGLEGMVGLPLLSGVGTASARVLCQVPGEALRLDGAVFCEVARTHPALYTLLARYSQFLWEQAAQTAACNKLHTNEERMARWLLMTRDRVRADAFPLTHEFLAELLGVGRPTVTIIAGMLQQAGLIQYHRGHITIVDRAGLEGLTCECYLVLRNRYGELLGPAPERR